MSLLTLAVERLVFPKLMIKNTFKILVDAVIIGGCLFPDELRFVLNYVDCYVLMNLFGFFKLMTWKCRDFVHKDLKSKLKKKKKRENGKRAGREKG